MISRHVVLLCRVSMFSCVIAALMVLRVGAVLCWFSYGWFSGGSDAGTVVVLLRVIAVVTIRYSVTCCTVSHQYGSDSSIMH